MTKSNQYIVMERGYEYNDEGYDSYDGGTPTRIFDNIEDANLEVDRLNRKFFRENNPFQEGYIQLWNDGMINELNVLLNSNDSDDYYPSVSPKIDDATLDKVIDLLTHHKMDLPYYVVTL